MVVSTIVTWTFITPGHKLTYPRIEIKTKSVDLSYPTVTDVGNIGSNGIYATECVATVVV